MTWISTFAQDCSKTNLEMFQIEKKSEIAAADNDVGIGIGGTVVIAFFSTFQRSTMGPNVVFEPG